EKMTGIATNRIDSNQLNPTFSLAILHRTVTPASAAVGSCSARIAGSAGPCQEALRTDRPEHPMNLHPFGSLSPVSTLTLGGGGLGMLWGETTFEECVATVRAAVDAGIN